MRNSDRCNVKAGRPRLASVSEAKSDENQLAISRQREDVLALCERLGWDSAVEYCDNNISATTGRRKAYERLCADIADGVVKRVAVWEMDRLHRQPRELEDFIEARRQTRRRDGQRRRRTSTCPHPSGRMFRPAPEATSPRMKSPVKSARQKRANLQRAEAGKPWVQRSFGYDGNTIVPKEAAAIRKACHALLNGATLWSIAKDWNAKGLKTSKGYQWEGSKVRQLLLRPSIAGLAVHNGEILDGVTPAWKPIIDRDTWESVRKCLSDPKRFTGRSLGRKHLLSRHRLLRRVPQADGHHCPADQERHETRCLPMQKLRLHEDQSAT